MKNKDKKDEAFTATEVGALVEDLKSQFRIFGEQLGAIEERLTGRIDGIAANQAKTLERITSLEITVRKIQSDIIEIKDNFKDRDKRLTHLEALK